MPDLVTGATGHLGANLVRRLLADGRAVRVLVRRGSDRAAIRGLVVEAAEGDLLDPDSLALAVRGCERVFHCAARISTSRARARDTWRTNVLGTRNTLNAAREAGARRVVVTGSLSAVGRAQGRPCNEEDPFDPSEAALPYEMSKALAERECWKAAARGMEVVLAVSCAILGGNDFKPSRLGRALIDFAGGRMPFAAPGGFEFVAARDIAQGHVLAMEKGRSGESYIFASGFLTVGDLLVLFEQVTGRRRPRWEIPGPLLTAAAHAVETLSRPFRPDWEPRFTPGAVRLLRSRRRADCGKARRELGFLPTPLAQSVQEAYDFFRERGSIA